MGRRRPSQEEVAAAGAGAGAIPDAFPPDLQWPFGRLDSLTRDDLRESAYEIFFTASRSSGSGSASARPDNIESPCSPSQSGSGGKNMAVASRLKRALGLRARKARPLAKGARPATSAEIMRRQMGVTEHSDGRVRKTLARSLVGPHKVKKVESLVLPMELLRHLKPVDFADASEHRSWQLRQLRLLEAGLAASDRAAASTTLREMVRATEQQARPLDVRALSVAVMALAWRSVEACHWADAYPVNVHLYLSLLRAVFDLREETSVLDEVDELLELIKKTWTVLGINRMLHNVCLAWLLFERYVVTGEMEPELLSATLAMLEQMKVAGDQEPAPAPAVLASTLASMRAWAEGKLLDYHEAALDDGTMENVVSLAVSTAAMLSAADCIPSTNTIATPASISSQVERYIRSSVRRAFNKVNEGGGGNGEQQKQQQLMDSLMVEVEEDPCETLMYVAAETREVARVEKEMYSPVLRQWHPCPTAVAAVTLHGCFGQFLGQHVSSRMGMGMGIQLSAESVRALRAAAKLDKVLVQMAMDDDDNGCKHPIKMMKPYEVDSIICGLVKGWMDERLGVGAECVRRAKESESWNPMSKAEPYAQSAVDLMKLAKLTVDELLEINHAGAAQPDLLHHLVDGIDDLVHQYASLLASSCGSKQSYVPPLPPLTRCNQDPKLLQLWRKAAPPCQVGIDDDQRLINCGEASSTPRPRLVVQQQQQQARATTSRGTQRLYVRLNTLHYMLATLHSIDKSLSSAAAPALTPRAHRRRASFDRSRPSLDAAILHVSELSAYRLVFLDSAHELHQALYQGGVAGARIRPALRVMKHNLAFLAGVLTERAQPLALRELMKASIQSFLTVLLAGGSGRAFSRADYGALVEDLESLKRLLGSCGCGEEAVEREAAAAEGVLALMALPTERLIGEFVTRHCTTPTPVAHGHGDLTALPPTTRRWSRSDANTVLRVLCHRDDEAASRFLKKTFDLPKRR